MLTQEDNLLFQSYFTFVLLVELNNNKFLQTQSFRDMKFGSPWIKEKLTDIGIDNQGCLLIALYVMLVIPRELISKKYSNEYNGIRKFLESHAQNTSTTYKGDSPTIDYLRHIRNSVAHSRVSFRPNDVVIFEDKNARTGEAFRTEVPLQNVGELIQQLQEIHLQYIKDLQQSQ